MPAQEDYLRDIKLMHVVFCISCIALVVASLWAVYADYNDEWRDLQILTYKLQSQQVRDEERRVRFSDAEGVKERLAAALGVSADSLTTDQATAAEQGYEVTKQQLEGSVKRTEDDLTLRQSEIDALTAKISELQGQVDLKTQRVKFIRAERDKVRADVGLEIRDGAVGAELQEGRGEFDKIQKQVVAEEAELQKLEAQLGEAKDALAKITAPRDVAAAALKKFVTEEERLRKARNQVDPQDTLAAAKWNLMELPIIEGFNSHLKLNQLWLPELTINYGGMRNVARFDRCTTCHMHIDKTLPGNLPAFPFDPHGISPDNARELLQKDAEAERAALAAGKPYNPERTYAHPFATHPRPDLFLTSASPHPMQQFGCTGCHDGQGSGTSFHNVQHMPDDPAIGEHWNKKYGWFYNHFWEYPMFPKRLAESGCIKCHHNVVELGEHPKFGRSAPKAYEGFQLIGQYGCFGCHEINGYNAGKPIGPDLRLEPQTPDEAARIAADPTAVAGEYRKVGPGLRHVASKVTRSFTEYWVEDPTKFHPETRMPRFFDLTNQKDETAKAFKPVEIAGIAKFLEMKSEPLEVEDWGDYQPSAVRGKTLISQRGCFACHKHEDFPGVTADFGPDLTHAHDKIRRDGEETEIVVPDGEGTKTVKIALSKWLYTWVRDPTRHSARTKMPNLYLEPEGEGEKRVDPAADIVAYLLHKPVREFDKINEGSEQFQAELDRLTRLYLGKVLSQEAVEKTMQSGEYPVSRSLIKGDEIELAIDLSKLEEDERRQAFNEAKLAYVGRRSISRYGCYGCHDIPEFERARPIGTALQDWGRKDPTKLALEHIEEYLHHHGEPDGSSTAKRVEEAVKAARGGSFSTTEDHDRETSAAYFYEQLLSHGRPGFIWQKLRDPRSYDYETLDTKGYDERLRMPKFPFTEKQIESIATFVLGLTAEPPAEKYVYRPNPRAKARIEGEKVLARYNCTSCHMVELPEVRRKVAAAEFRLDASTADGWKTLRDDLEAGKYIPYLRGKSADDLRAVTWNTLESFTRSLREQLPDAPRRSVPADELGKLYDRLAKTAPKDGAKVLQSRFDALVREIAFADFDPSRDHLPGLDLLMQLKRPRADQLSGTKAVQTVSFHGLPFQGPDPEEDPADQVFLYVNWETHELGQRIVMPQSNIEIPVDKHVSYKPGRGGEFALWLVNALRGNDTGKELFDKSLQQAPPILYQQGIKVQTPWLYDFLRNPPRLRYTTVLRMPQFNLSEKEASQLANYFAAIDGAEFPYQRIEEREPDYLATMESLSADKRDAANDYLDESFKVINVQLCNGCHAVAGKPYSGNPNDPKVIRGPNLDFAGDRLRPDWLQLWLYKPGWITPYTSMPQPFPPAAKKADGTDNDQNPTLFHGDEILQTIGARDALMNYHRLMERRRPLAAASPAEPAPAEPNDATR